MGELAREANRQLLAEIRQLLAELELISHGTTPAYNPAGARPTPGPSTRTPSGGLRRGEGNHEEFRRRLQGAKTVRALEAIRDDLREALTRFKYSPMGGVDPKTTEGKMKIARDPRPVEELATIYGLSERQIYRIRSGRRSAA